MSWKRGLIMKSDEYSKIIEEVSELSEKYYSIEEINFDAEVEKTLMGLGFVRSDFTRPTHEFSGGWRMRIELAKILLQKPDLILLDEPTNHMDIESIQWLEEFLINNAKAVIVISHDKTFVDNLTNRTIEMTMGRIYDYRTNYTHYLQLRRERRDQQQKQFDDQQKQIADIQGFIDRFKGTYSKTLQVQSRVKMLDKIEIVQVDEVDSSALNLKFPPAPMIRKLSGYHRGTFEKLWRARGVRRCSRHNCAWRKSGFCWKERSR
jgi:ATP-binding cassette subfamily F protein 3